MDKKGYAEISDILTAGSVETEGHKAVLSPSLERLAARPDQLARFIGLSFSPDTAVDDVLNMLDDGGVLRTEARVARAAGPLLRMVPGAVLLDESYLHLTFEDLNNGVPATSILDEMSGANATLNTEWLNARASS